jgi:hypothetical protein
MEIAGAIVDVVPKLRKKWHLDMKFWLVPKDLLRKVEEMAPENWHFY